MPKKINSISFFLALVPFCVNASDIATLSISSDRSCAPYSAIYDKNKHETLIDFNRDISGKVTATFDGSSRKVIARKVGSFFVFNGDYKTANLNFERCNARLDLTEDVKEDDVIRYEIKQERENLAKIQDQMTQLLAKIEQQENSRNLQIKKNDINSEPLTIPAPQVINNAVKIIDTASQISKVENNTVSQKEEKFSKKEDAHKDEVIVNINDWTLDEISQGYYKPLKKWVIDEKSHSMKMDFTSGRSIQVIYAKNKNGDNLYKGKINQDDIVYLPYIADEIKVQVKDYKGRNFYYLIKPIVTIKESVVPKNDVIKSVVNNDQDKSLPDVKKQNNAHIVNSYSDNNDEFKLDHLTVLESYKKTLNLWKEKFNLSAVVYDAPEVVLIPTTIKASTLEEALSIITPDIKSLGVRTNFYTSNRVIEVKGDIHDDK